MTENDMNEWKCSVFHQKDGSPIVQVIKTNEKLKGDKILSLKEAKKFLKENPSFLEIIPENEEIKKYLSN